MKRIKKIVIPIVLGILQSVASQSYAASGQKVGNGGDLLVCKDEKGTIQSLELIDYYEGRALRQIEQMALPEQSIQEATNSILSKLYNKAPNSSLKIQKYIDQFWEEARFVEKAKFVDINDSEHLFFPPGCSVEQVAIQSNPKFQGDPRYIISKDLWDLMPLQQKVGLIFHETLYKMAIEKGAVNSINTRYLNSLLNSESINQVPLKTLYYLFQQHGLDDFSYQKLKIVTHSVQPLEDHNYFATLAEEQNIVLFGQTVPIFGHVIFNPKGKIIKLNFKGTLRVPTSSGELHLKGEQISLVDLLNSHRDLITAGIGMNFNLHLHPSGKLALGTLIDGEEHKIKNSLQELTLIDAQVGLDEQGFANYCYGKIQGNIQTPLQKIMLFDTSAQKQSIFFSKGYVTGFRNHNELSAPVNEKQSLIFKKDNYIQFHESGYVKSGTVLKDATINLPDLGAREIKSNEYIHFSSDHRLILEPLKVNNINLSVSGANFDLIEGSVEYYESGAIKIIRMEKGSADIKIPNQTISPPETVEFYEDGKVKRVHSRMPSTIRVADQTYKGSAIELYPSGVIKNIHLADVQFIKNEPLEVNFDLSGRKKSILSVQHFEDLLTFRYPEFIEGIKLKPNSSKQASTNLDIMELENDKFQSFVSWSSLENKIDMNLFGTPFVDVKSFNVRNEVIEVHFEGVINLTSHVKKDMAHGDVICKSMAKLSLEGKLLGCELAQPVWVQFATNLSKVSFWFGRPFYDSY